MKFTKQKLSSAEMGYFITNLHLLGQDRIVAAPEATGPALVFSPPTYEPQILNEGPGGCMGFAPVPGHDDAFLMITEFYPIFKSEKAGINLFRAIDGFNEPWQGKRIIDLPFVHRICVVGNGTDNYLVAAAVCGGKDFQDDWSRPGVTYAAKVPEDIDGPWELVPVMDPIHRNHGMQVGSHGGKPCVFITGDEGLFVLEVPAAGSTEWKSTLVIKNPISEVYPADLDQDGEDEIAVIEPFHGNAMSVYKNIEGTWTKIYTAALAFGHGLWAGNLGGENVVIAGNRADSKNLACFKVTSTSPFMMEESVIDEGSGTTNMTVIDTHEGKALATSNPGHVEYALYMPKA
jgi:hypothetical protein